MRYATNPAIAMMMDRIAVNMPDQAEKSKVKFPNKLDGNEYVGTVVGQVNVFRRFNALSNPEPFQRSM
jgi:hypothetical protein